MGITRNSHIDFLMQFYLERYYKAYAHISFILQCALSDKLITSICALELLHTYLYYTSTSYSDNSPKVLFHFIRAILIQKIKQHTSVSTKLQLL